MVQFIIIVYYQSQTAFEIYANMKKLYLKSDNISNQSRQPRVSGIGNKGKGEKKTKNVLFLHRPQINQVTAGRILIEFPNACFQSTEQF